eukprot:7262002-Prymnesium_polylepis.1
MWHACVCAVRGSRGATAVFRGRCVQALPRPATGVTAPAKVLNCAPFAMQKAKFFAPAARVASGGACGGHTNGFKRSHPVRRLSAKNERFHLTSGKSTI